MQFSKATVLVSIPSDGAERSGVLASTRLKTLSVTVSCAPGYVVNSGEEMERAGNCEVSVSLLTAVTDAVLRSVASSGVAKAKLKSWRVRRRVVAVHLMRGVDGSSSLTSLKCQFERVTEESVFTLPEDDDEGSSTTTKVSAKVTVLDSVGLNMTSLTLMGVVKLNNCGMLVVKRKGESSKVSVNVDDAPRKRGRT